MHRDLGLHFTGMLHGKGGYLLPMFQVNMLVHNYQYKPHNIPEEQLNYTGRSMKSHIPGYISTIRPGITIDHSKSYRSHQLWKLTLTVKKSSFAHLIIKYICLAIM